MEFTTSIVILATILLMLMPVYESRLLYPLPESCKRVLDCVFSSRTGDSLEPLDLYDFPHLISLRDLRPNSSIMNGYKEGNEHRTSHFRVQKIFAGGLAFIRSGMLFKYYNEEKIYPLLSEVRVSPRKRNETLQGCVDHYCKYIAGFSPVLRCTNSLLANMHLETNRFTTHSCIECIKYLDFRGTDILSTNLSIYNLKYLYHLNLLYGSLVNNTFADLARFVQNYPRAILLQLPGQFGFLNLCRFVYSLPYFGEIRTTRFVLWPFFHKYMDVYDSETKCVRTYFTVNCTRTKRPEFCLDASNFVSTSTKSTTTTKTIAPKHTKRVELVTHSQSYPTNTDTTTSAWQSFKTIIKIILFLVMFALLTLLVYLILREFEALRYFWDIGRDLAMQLYRWFRF